LMKYYGIKNKFRRKLMMLHKKEKIINNLKRE